MHCEATMRENLEKSTHQYNAQASALATFLVSGSASISRIESRIYKHNEKNKFAAHHCRHLNMAPKMCTDLQLLRSWQFFHTGWKREADYMSYGLVSHSTENMSK